MSARLREIARRTEGIVHIGHYRSPEGRDVTRRGTTTATSLDSARRRGRGRIPRAHARGTALRPSRRAGSALLINASAHFLAFARKRA